MISNREISSLFGLFAELLLLHKKDGRLAALLSAAAFRLRSLQEGVVKFSKKELSKLFRSEIAKLVLQLKDTDTIEELDELIQLTPPGLFEMMRIRGLGGKKLALLWHTAGIDSMDRLLEACKNNELRKVPGFGAKTQANIIAAIDSYRSSQDRFHLASVYDAAIDLEDTLQQIFKTKLLSLCGEVRRQSTTVAGIEFISAISSKILLQKIPRKKLIIQSSSKAEIKGHTVDEIPVSIYLTDKESFYRELFNRTGSNPHVKKVLAKTKSRRKYISEESIYKAAGLPYIVPKMRKRARDLFSLSISFN